MVIDGFVISLVVGGIFLVVATIDLIIILSKRK